MTNSDPAAFFRDMLGEWEKMANSVGGGLAKSDEFARAMHNATAAQMNTQSALNETMAKALAAANMPSKAEIEDLSARLARVEASLGRIETLLGGAGDKPKRPKPSRGRKPPEKRA
jgi:Poly(R)-hydroxyalkanoic acid synthase subunit (PHA_synth_III_E)